jgi:hypothetical protein
MSDSAVRNGNANGNGATVAVNALELAAWHSQHRNDLAAETLASLRLRSKLLEVDSSITARLAASPLDWPDYVTRDCP